MKITINQHQKGFIQTAINLYRHVIDFDVDEEEFEEMYGLSKEDYDKEIQDLEEILK